jgi:hypothetical protein
MSKKREIIFVKGVACNYSIIIILDIKEALVSWQLI